MKALYGLTMTVLYDPLKLVTDAPLNFPKNHLHVVTGPGSEVLYKGNNDGLFQTIINDTLGL